MQNRDNQHQPCRTCHAPAGKPCTIRRGVEAARVHYGRGSYRECRTWKPKAPRRTLTPSPEYAAAYAEMERRRYGD